MNTSFYSRWDFKKKAIPVLDKDLHAVISFNDNSREMEDMRKAVPKEISSFFCVAKDDEKDFSLALAKEIVKFVEANKDKCFIVHCFAGVSRSAAISRWIEIHLNGRINNPSLANYQLYNKHIFNTMVKAYL